MTKIKVVFNEQQIICDENSTISALIKHHKIISVDKLQWIYFQVNNLQAIVSRQYIVHDDDVIKPYIITNDDLNHAAAALLVGSLLGETSEEIIIRDVNFTSESFSVDYIMPANKKTSSIKSLLLLLQKNGKRMQYVWWQENLKHCQLSKGELVKTAQQNFKFRTLKLCQFICLTYSHSLVDQSLSLENKKIVRVGGICSCSSKQLVALLATRMAKKKGDHREINKYLKLFLLDDQFGAGLPAILEPGTRVINSIEQYFQKSNFFQHALFIKTPIFAHQNLYTKSGHLKSYKSSMFPVIKLDGHKENLVLRPMSCPHHCIVFSKQQYRAIDLPITYCENALLFRYEASGALNGLQRTRQMTLFDSHTFAVKTDEKILEILLRELTIVAKVMVDFGIHIDYYRLSVNDDKQSSKFIQNKELWDRAISLLQKALVVKRIQFRIENGHAAFYGPKVDIQIKTNLGESITISTIQLDLVLAEKLTCSYRDPSGQNMFPAVIHSGFIGTYERFLSILLEQNRGILPFWLNPNKIIIITLKQKFLPTAIALKRSLKMHNISSTIDASEQHLNIKIKDAYQQRVNFFVVVGSQEHESSSYYFHSVKSGIKYYLNHNELATICQYE